MSMVGDFFDAIDAAVDNFILEGYTNVADALDTPLQLLLILFVAVYGFGLLFGRIEMPVRDAIRHVLIATFVVTFATTTYAAEAATFVSQVFIDGPNQLASAIVGGAGGGSGSLKDTLGVVWDQGMEAGSRTWESGGFFSNQGAFLMALVVWIVTVVMLVPAVGYLVLAKVALAVLLVLTPFMAVLFLFRNTKGIFEGWLRQVINFALIPVLIFGILALILNIAEAAAEQISGATRAGGGASLIPAIGAYTLVGAVAAILFLQVNTIAAGIAGGMSLSTLGGFAKGGRRAARIARRGAQRLAGRSPTGAGAGRGAQRLASRLPGSSAAHSQSTTGARGAPKNP